MRTMAGLALALGLALAACGGGSGSSTKAFCDKAKSIKNDKSLNQLSESQDPKQQLTAFAKGAKALVDLKKKAPAAVKADIAKISDDFTQANTEFQRAKGDISKVDP